MGPDCSKPYEHSATCALICVGVFSASRKLMEKEMIGQKLNSGSRVRVWSADSGSRDARKALRYCVRAKAKFHWTLGNGLSREVEGVTRDVSPKGAYVFAAECPPRGTHLEMLIDLPSMGKGTNDLRIRAECSVLRVEKSSGKKTMVGFSVENSRVTLCED